METKQPISQTREITAAVRKIRVDGGLVKVVLKQTSTPSLEVRAMDSKFLSKVLTTIEQKRLTVSFEPMVIIQQAVDGSSHITNMGSVFIGGGSGGRAKGIQINSVNGSIQISGSGNVVQNFFGGVQGNVVVGDMVVGDQEPFNVHANELMEGQFIAEVLIGLPEISDIDVRGAANLQCLALKQDDLSVAVSGSGQVHLDGSVRDMDVEVSGSGAVRALDLQATKARLRVSGSGSIRANILDAVKARISGSGSVRIAGNPVDRDTDVSGSGRVTFVD